MRGITMAKTIAVADQQMTGLERLKSQPQRTIEFLKDVRSEMRKVVAPTRAEVQSTTTIVIVTVFIFAGYFFVVDSILGQGVTRMIQYLTKH
jgi:preprotein translocase subunit SecE